MKTLKFLILAIIATGLAACGDDNEATLPPVSSRPLTISVSETPYINPDAPAGAPQSRAAITTTSSLSSFNLVYVYGSGSSNSNSPYSVTNSAGTWSGGSWPDTDYAVNWYAFNDGTLHPNSGDPYIDFSVEESSANQKDLLVSTASGTYAGTGGKLSFTFDHACSALRFLVKKSTNLSAYTLTVSEIQLCNVVNKGNYHYNTSSWTLAASTSHYTLYSGSGMTLGTASYELLGDSESPYLFFIPQTLTPWDGSDSSKTYLKVTCSIVRISDSSTVYSGDAYIPFGATLDKGYQYDVKINIGKNSLLKSDRTQIITD